VGSIHNKGKNTTSHLMGLLCQVEQADTMYCIKLDENKGGNHLLYHNDCQLCFHPI
jgi:hypothetical protein